MIERVNKNNLDEYENFIKNHPRGLFMHSSTFPDQFPEPWLSCGHLRG